MIRLPVVSLEPSDASQSNGGTITSGSRSDPFSASVGVDGHLPYGRIGFPERARIRDEVFVYIFHPAAGVVHKHVEASELRYGGVNDTFTIGRSRNVCGEGEHRVNRAKC